MALFNRGSSRRDGPSLHLQESIDPHLASIFVEHNGPLVAISDPVLRQAVLAELFTQCHEEPDRRAPAHPRRLVLSGVGPDCADAVTMTGGLVDEKSRRMAPFSDLRSLDRSRSFIEFLSRNTRHQLRRSNRLYAAQGELAIRRAETVDEGRTFLAKMIELHDITWKARGKKGAFATAAVRRFYETLIETGVPAGEVDLLRITAGEAVIGYLMNFTHNGVVSAYQSGFDYATATPQQKPGIDLALPSDRGVPRARSGDLRFPGRRRSIQAEPGQLASVAALAERGASVASVFGRDTTTPTPQDLGMVAGCPALSPSEIATVVMNCVMLAARPCGRFSRALARKQN